MAPKRSKKKVVGTLVKRTKKVMEEKLTVSVERKGANGEEVEEIVEVLPTSKEKRVAKEVEETLTVSVEEEEGANEEEGEEIESELPINKEKKQEEEKTNKKKEVGEKSKKKKKRGSRNATAGEVSGNYKRYVYMVLKQVHPELGVSSMAMAVIDAMMRDMFERIAGEAARLSKHAQKVTLSSRDIQSAVQLVLPGELGKHAVSEGTKAITNYVTAG